MRVRRVLTAMTGVVLLALCGACSSSDEGSQDEPHETEVTQQQTQGEGMDPETEKEMMPAGKPLGLDVMQPPGSPEEVVPGLTVTVPDGAAKEEASTSELAAVTYRMPNAVDGLPVLQVASAGLSSDSVYAETWVQEKALATDPKVSDIHRSQEQWPNATEAVAFAWTQQIALQDDSVLEAEVLTLWLRDAAGHSFKLTAMAPRGELTGSASYEALLSATLTDDEN